MSFLKFVSLLATSSLYFCRIDKLKDQYEGSIPRANLALRQKCYTDTEQNSNEILKEHDRIISWHRQWTYVNCWHANPHESAAMWKLYALMDQTIAIKSSYELLTNALPDCVCLGMVNYIDYETECVPEGNALSPFMHKGISFVHECEVRALIQNIPELEEGTVTPDMTINNTLTGTPVKIELDRLIEAVYVVAPNEQIWFVETVKAVMRKFGLNKHIYPSILGTEPYRPSQ